MSTSFPIQNRNVQIDWSGCALVEKNPLKLSGVPILKGTRVQADSIVENFWGGSPIEEISENFFLPEATIRELLSYANGKENHAR
jgi:uncharacterized protein (DUF433 family)